jgi:hypothetical protein
VIRNSRASPLSEEPHAIKKVATKKKEIIACAAGGRGDPCAQ